MSVVIKPPSRGQNVSFLNKLDEDALAVNPGDVITADTDFMRGHGTYQVSNAGNAEIIYLKTEINLGPKIDV